MRSFNLAWTAETGLTRKGVEPADLVLFFGQRAALEDGQAFAAFRNAFPGAILAGCSTGGQICEAGVDDGPVRGLGLRFERTRLKIARQRRDDHVDSRAVGAALAQELAAPDLAGVFVIADGLCFDGAALASGIDGALGARAPVTGGLAGDGGDFHATLVAADEAPQPGLACAIGFYGEAARVGHGYAGGWDVFGPRRRITRSHENVVFELDGKPALDLYERYLGEEADGLPGSGLLFPLRIFDPADPESGVVRTLLAIDREARSITFAGSMPQGWMAQLMRGSLDRLVAIAGAAGERARLPDLAPEETAAVLVSCIGRRLLMGQRAPEEVAAAVAGLGAGVTPIGFYSYGEISPNPVSGRAELHNQTMTVMTIGEATA